MATAAELLFPKLVVFGATGPTGRSLVEQALQKGYYVTAVARNPAAMDIKYTNLYNNYMILLYFFLQLTYLGHLNFLSIVCSEFLTWGH